MKGWSVWVDRNGQNYRCRWTGRHGAGSSTFSFAQDARELRDLKRRNFQRLDAGLPELLEGPKTVKLSEWSEKYLSERSKNPRKNTVIKDRESLTQFLEWSKPKIGDAGLSTVTAAHVYAWKDWLYETKKYSNATVRMRLAHLKPAFVWAKQRGWVQSNVAEDVEMPKPTRAGRVLSGEEISKLYSLLPTHVLPAFVLLLNSGMRKGEVLSLLKSQVERLDSPELWRVHFGEHQTKNKHPKAVVLLPAAKEAVESAMKASASERVFDKLTKDVFDHWMRRIKTVLGQVRLHDLKHTFCTHWMRSTGDLYGLQQMTGNSLSSLRIYNHLALGTPRGLANFAGFTPSVHLNSISPQK